jgi:hypothetical protein
MRTKENRKKFLIDVRLQGMLWRRIVAIWLLGGVLVFAFPISVTFLFGMVGNIPADELFRATIKTLWFPALSAILLVPWGIWYSIRISHRIAGPMFRFKREVRNLLNGQPSRPLNLRESDFFKDFASDLDRLIASHRHLEKELSEATRQLEQIQLNQSLVESGT